MEVSNEIGWKQFAIRLIEALRWPAAFVAAIVILREPLGAFINMFPKIFWS
jgi:hypothetical protein